MGKIRITADSTCDLSESLLQKYGISILPLNIVLDMKSYSDGEEISPDEIYVWSEKMHKTPKTAAVAYDRALEMASAFQKNGDEMIFFGISESMSTTCNVMRMVKEELNYTGMYVIDSQNLSTGIGLQVLRAAELAGQGLGAQEIVTQIEQERSRVRASFVVERLDYLAMGGRCSSVVALFGGKLKLKPRIEVTDGKMEAGKKYRGNQDKVILKYVQDMEMQLRQADPHRIFITHSGCEEAVIRSVEEYLKGLHHFEEILITRAGGVISSHCGPGTLGVLFYEKG
ncbi:MAG TPA: DegV family protein [Candidatus Eisenbergiella intestinigallinarum]|uniref:DegV family protein n=1 Tax=Candidatus Eisenbergiella intestinigallinarum TaxID=2838549 RepID=A0A9D2QKP0_9FIRM|nr:DegV family protein [Candidatus Eisenbergiella intestinigallinarum]